MCLSHLFGFVSLVLWWSIFGKQKSIISFAHAQTNVIVINNLPGQSAPENDDDDEHDDLLLKIILITLALAIALLIIYYLYKRFGSHHTTTQEHNIGAVAGGAQSPKPQQRRRKDARPRVGIVKRARDERGHRSPVRNAINVNANHKPNRARNRQPFWRSRMFSNFAKRSAAIKARAINAASKTPSTNGTPTNMAPSRQAGNLPTASATASFETTRPASASFVTTVPRGTIAASAQPIMYSNQITGNYTTTTTATPTFFITDQRVGVTNPAPPQLNSMRCFVTPPQINMPIANYVAPGQPSTQQIYLAGGAAGATLTPFTAQTFVPQPAMPSNQPLITVIRRDASGATIASSNEAVMDGSFGNVNQTAILAVKVDRLKNQLLSEASR